ncbi:MAG: hypothetical protein V1791_15790 [Pseudomonadota bacterium]
MTDAAQRYVVPTISSDRVNIFFPLLQQGVGVKCRVGCSLDRLLSEEWQLSPDYVAQRITTIFVDGRAVDDVTRAIVRAGSVIALSGAMPGLVGATMRRGGYYAALRGAITHRETYADSVDRIATVRVKLFNLLLPEIGPQFLRRGVLLNASEAATFFNAQGEEFWGACEDALLDDDATGESTLCDADTWDQEIICLRVQLKENSVNISK